MAAVVDEFTRASFAPELVLRSLDARTWRLRLPMFRPDVLFVESAWRGRRGSWKRKIARYDHPRPGDVLALVRYCRRRGIPTLFWNKEDPVHFDRFIGIAAEFDVIFTTDADKIADYERRLGRRGCVHALAFGVQPALYPPGPRQRERAVCFAGSFGEREFADRRAALAMLLDAAADFDLRIFDRNANKISSAKAFPDRFAPFIRGERDYRMLAAEYQRCRAGLNVNSVTQSPTMFSRRVLEMLACGTPVVSTPSAGITELLGDAVHIVDNRDAARAVIGRLLDDDAFFAESSRRGQMRVLSSHTVAHRLRELVDKVGIEVAS